MTNERSAQQPRSSPRSQVSLQDSLATLPQQQKERLADLLKELESARRTNAIDQLFPPEGPVRRELYVKHMAFFTAGKHERERAFLGGNRTGKTSSGGGYEMALHLMGIYPGWWEGRRFSRPVRAWAAGDTGETVREIIQPALFGPPGHPGTGLIRASSIVSIRNRRGSPDAIESAQIRHASGRGSSTILLKSYEQGRKAFQGTKQDLIWLDEEPPMSVYAECLLRLTATTPEGDDWGSMICTFTPLLGISEVVLRYMGEQERVEPVPRARQAQALPDEPPPQPRPRRDLMGDTPSEPHPMDWIR